MPAARTWTLARPDGVEIAVHSRGEGPDIVLVHGTACDHRVWARVAHRLADRFTVHALDRRGRGQSTDADRWSLAKDAEDVAAIVGELGRGVPVVGHSLGGIVAIEAAAHHEAVGPVVAYEPPVYADERPPEQAARELDQLLAKEGPEAVVERFLREVGYDDAQLESLRRIEPIWQATLATAPTLPREARADLAYRIDAKRLASIDGPVLLVAGGASPGTFEEGLARMAKAIAHARRETIAGARHGVLHEAPQAFAETIGSFLDEQA